jgi:hypothetical protein
MSRPSRAHGVGKEVDALSDMVSPRACCCKNGRPAGVIAFFQVIKNSVEPLEPIPACNLLAKDAVRSALADEFFPCRPQVPMIVESLGMSGDGCD